MSRKSYPPSFVPKQCFDVSVKISGKFITKGEGLKLVKLANAEYKKANPDSTNKFHLYQRSSTAPPRAQFIIILCKENGDQIGWVAIDGSPRFFCIPRKSRLSPGVWKRGPWGSKI